MESESILQQVIIALRGRQRWIERSRIYLDALLACLVCLCSLLLWHRFIFPVPALPLVSAGIGGLGFLVASLLLLWRKPRPAELLIQADRQLHLQERLSTAYEVAKKEKHPFRTTLLAEVARVAPTVNPSQVFPWKFPRRLWCIAPLLLVSVGLVFFEFPMSGSLFFDSPSVEPQIRSEFTKLEKFAQRLEQRARRERLEKSWSLAQRMQKLEANPQLEDSPRKQAVARVSSLLDYVRNLQEELQKESLLSDLDIQQIREVFTARNNLAQELQQILQMLTRGEFGSGDTGTAERNLEQLIGLMGEEGGSLSKELQEALKTLQAGDVQGAQDILQTLLRQQKFAEDHENLRKAEEALRESAQALSDHPESVPSVSDLDYAEGGSASQTGQQGNQGEMGGGDLGGEDLEGMDAEGNYMSSRQPGSASGSDKETAQQKLEEEGSPQLTKKIEGQTGEGEMHRVYIKALPLQSKSSLPLEEVIVDYQHRAEEIMVKEEVPVHYRDYIRNYFLAIGMFEGNDGKGQSSTDSF